LLRIVLSVLLAGFAVVITATPALAHTTLKTSNPADGAQLGAAPTSVTLTFEEAVTLPADPVSVVGPGGEAWDVGTPTITGPSVTVPVGASGPAGQYTLRYTVTADDGDLVRGTVHFTLTSPATPASADATADALDTVTAEAAPATVVTAAPATAAQGSDSSGSSAWVYIALAVVVIGVLAGMAFVFRSRRSGRTKV
jgi:methionine-rich copper-binding protein CopC